MVVKIVGEDVAELGFIVLDILMGSVVFVLETTNLTALKELWKKCRDDSFRNNLNIAIKESQEMEENFKGVDIDVIVDIDEEEFREACWELHLFSQIEVVEEQAKSSEFVKRQRRHSLSCEQDLPAGERTQLVWQDWIKLKETYNELTMESSKRRKAEKKVAELTQEIELHTIQEEERRKVLEEQQRSENAAKIDELQHEIDSISKQMVEVERKGMKDMQAFGTPFRHPKNYGHACRNDSLLHDRNQECQIMEFGSENLDYFRLCYIVTRVFPEGLRTIFKREWDALYDGTPHGPWNDSPANYNSFYSMESSKNRRSKQQLLKMMTNGDRSKWDCTCLFYAIMYSDSVGPMLHPIVKSSIDDVRDIRSKVFAHNIDGGVTEPDFQASITKIINAFTALKLDTTKLEELKNQSTFPTDELKNIKQQLEDEKKRNEEPSSFCVLPAKPSHDTIDRMDEVGRIFEQMNRLSSEKKGKTTVVYLSGMPRCGKSEMARQIGEKYFLSNDTTDLVFIMTINASNMDTLLQSYVEFATRLKCHPNDISRITTSKVLSQENRIKQLRALTVQQVDKYPCWLMIVDNVNDLDSFSKYWPQTGGKTRGGSGQILVTTQDSESICITSNTQHLPSETGFLSEDVDDIVDCLEAIGGICEVHGHYETAKCLYQICLAIQLSVYEHKGLLSKVKDVLNEIELAFKTDHGRLEDTSLGKILSTHGPVDYSGHSSLGRTLNRLGSTLEKLAQYDEAKSCFERALAINETAYGENHPSVGSVHNNLGATHQSMGQYDEAKSCFERALAINETAYGENHPSVGSVHNNLGATHQSMGQYDEAKSCFERALAINETAYGENHPSVGSVHNNLGATHQSMGQYDEAKSCFERALAIYETAYGENHPSLGDIRNNLGDIHQSLGQYDEAKSCLERALAIYETAYGENHPSVGSVHNNLGATHQSMGQYDQAKSCFQRALAIYETAYGENHPLVGSVHNNLGATHQSMGQYDQAKSCFQRALAIYETAYGENHPSLGDIRNNLGATHQSMGQYDEAKSCFERALAIYETAYGENHPSVGSVHNNLGATHQSMGQYDQAKSCFQRALAIYETAYGENHPSLGDIRNNLGATHQSMGQYDEAKSCFERALAIYETAYGENHPSVGSVHNNLGATHQSMGQYDEAKSCFQRALAINEILYGENHPSVGSVHNNLGATHQSMGQYDEAKSCCERALAINKTVYGENHPSVGSVQNNLGAIHKSMGQYDEAKSCFERALAIYETAYGENHPSVGSVHNNLGATHQSMGQYDEAKSCFERALAINKTAYGENHPSVGSVHNNLGAIHKSMGQYDEAKSCFARALAIYVTVYGENHPSVGSVQNNLGAIHKSMGQYDQAKSCFERALAIYETAYGQNHPSVGSVHNNLGAIHQSMGQYDEAKSCFERALAIYVTQCV
ncbi:hypothetical protein QZH41_008691, partial [Actinostola sp. cb2023]